MAGVIWIVTIFTVFIATCNASWGTPGHGQYHIQTDEGPERFFRFQTDNGQYRKEKRLQDGTVIGTDAWIDAAGYLRQKDYIADKKGYRILKSKTVYVGQGRPIEEAIRSVKNVGAQSGVLVPNSQTSSQTTFDLPSTTKKPVLIYSKTTTTRVTPPSRGYIPASIETTTAYPYLGYDHYPTPQVFIRHHAQPVEDNFLPGSVYLPSSTAIPTPSLSFQPPFTPGHHRRRFRPVGVLSTTPAPITGDGAFQSSSTPLPPISSSTASPIEAFGQSAPGEYPTTPLPYSPSPFSSPSPFAFQSTTPLPISSTTERPGFSSSTSDYDYYNNLHVSSTTVRPIAESSTRAPVLPIDGNGLDAQPLFTRGPSSSGRPFRNRGRVDPLVYNNNLGSGYDPQYAEYDGVAVTRNGFRYYLPRQYHEEEQIDGEKRDGSFGYIDPFGIRRVVYYNASPENGFVHRKNNRYVGFNATPYDPRPL